MFDASVEVQPPLSDQQLSQVPAKRGVLCLLDEQDRPIVLLTAADIRARLRNRLAEPLERIARKTADLRQITRRILWKLAHSHFETDLLYLELARAIWPAGYGPVLAWRQAWFVHVDQTDQYPRFVRTRDVFARRGLYLGPFPQAKAAEKFIDIIQDAFYLCRDYQCLRLAPHAPPCPYAQMGKCVSVGDGTTSLADYRKLIAKAAQFASGDREGFLQELRAKMAQAAKELKFERAAAIKAKLDRMKELDKPAYEHVAPAWQFQFVCVQRGASARQAKAFLVDRGDMPPGRVLDYPLAAEQLQELLGAMASSAASAPVDDLELRRWRVGLVSQYLFSGPGRRGLMLRWRGDLSAQDLAAAIEAASGPLGLKAPAPRKKPR